MKPKTLLLTSYTAFTFAVAIHPTAACPHAPVDPRFLPPLLPPVPPQELRVECPFTPHYRALLKQGVLRMLDHPRLGLLMLTVELATGRTWQELLEGWVRHSLDPASYQPEPRPPLLPPLPGFGPEEHENDASVSRDRGDLA